MSRRIRTIQPGFPSSPSMCRVSRDARLLFVQLWIYADDAGRLRPDLHLMASELYSRDTDAPTLLPGWLEELGREGCIERYSIGGEDYLRIVHWREHQKIDRPTPSRLPPSPSEPRSSRAPREASRGAREELLKSLEELEFSGVPTEAREENFFAESAEDDARPAEVTEQKVLRTVARILSSAEQRRVYTPALRAAELLGRRIGLWAGKKENNSFSPASQNPASPKLADVVPPTGVPVERS